MTQVSISKLCLSLQNLRDPMATLGEDCKHSWWESSKLWPCDRAWFPGWSPYSTELENVTKGKNSSCSWSFHGMHMSRSNPIYPSSSGPLHGDPLYSQQWDADAFCIIIFITLLKKWGDHIASWELPGWLEQREGLRRSLEIVLAQRVLPHLLQPGSKDHWLGWRQLCRRGCDKIQFKQGEYSA